MHFLFAKSGNLTHRALRKYYADAAYTRQSSFSPPQVTFSPSFCSLCTFLPGGRPPHCTHSIRNTQPYDPVASSRATAQGLQWSEWRRFSFCLGCPALGSVLQLPKLPLSSKNALGSAPVLCRSLHPTAEAPFTKVPTQPRGARRFASIRSLRVH